MTENKPPFRDFQFLEGPQTREGQTRSAAVALAALEFTRQTLKSATSLAGDVDLRNQLSDPESVVGTTLEGLSEEDQEKAKKMAARLLGVLNEELDSESKRGEQNG